MDKILLDLGLQPLVNNLCKTKIEALQAKKYPITASIDSNLLIKLNYEVESDELYKNYLYRSSVNTPYIEHCKKLWSSIKSIRPKTIIDIGGNDGTLLNTFKAEANYDLHLINVDASSSFKEENEEKGIRYFNNYFNKELDLPKADLITSTNVFQHTKDIKKFVEGIKKHLKGIWILEFPYTLRTFETLQFDQFYHEHFYYWLITPLEKIFANYDLEIKDYEELDIHGGTLRLYITKKSSSNKKSTIQKLLDFESNFDFFEASKKMKEKIIYDKKWLENLQGKTVFFGSAAKGCVYLNALAIKLDKIKDSYIVDDTFSKQNLYMPGTGLKVISRERLYKEQPENLIILAHNFKEHIIKSLRPKFKGNIITMLPKLEINNFF